MNKRAIVCQQEQSNRISVEPPNCMPPMLAQVLWKCRQNVVVHSVAPQLI
jgi:hypothetical protein